MSQRGINLNAELGAFFGARSMGHDSEMLQQVASASIACGIHAGGRGPSSCLP